jgi:hypothetical protein
VDGDVDIFVAAGMGYPFFYWPNSFYLNDGKSAFVERAAEVGIEPPANGELIGKRRIEGRGLPRSSRAAARAD